MLSESPPIFRRFLRFMALPYCYFFLINWNECTATRFKVICDLLYIFFFLKYFPDNYGPCRLWEKERKDWVYYYGSSYNSYPRMKLRKNVQPYDYQILFNDKAVCDLLCKGIGIRMPQTYGVIDDTMNYAKIINDIFLENHLRRLIIKPVLGHAGRGISMATIKDGNIEINGVGGLVALSDFILDGKHILQEVISQHPDISAIYSSSVNTIRVFTMYKKNGEVAIVSSSMRFGANNSFVDNWSAGGIAIGVDHDKGTLKKIAYDKHGNKLEEHPVSKQIFEGIRIPMWDEVLTMAIKIQKACPFYKLLGMDIAISNNEPVLVEVNANSDTVFQEQTSGPLLSDKRIFESFNEHRLLINKQQKNLYL